MAGVGVTAEHSDWSIATGPIETARRPDPPIAPFAATRTVDSVQVSWLPGDLTGASLSGYEVQRSGASDMSAPLTVQVVTAASAVYGGLALNEPSWFRVRSLVSGENESPSAYSPVSNAIYTLGQPERPASLQVTGRTPTCITVEGQFPEPRGATLSGVRLRTALDVTMAAALAHADDSLPTNTTPGATVSREFCGLRQADTYFFDFVLVVDLATGSDSEASVPTAGTTQSQPPRPHAPEVNSSTITTSTIGVVFTQSQFATVLGYEGKWLSVARTHGLRLALLAHTRYCAALAVSPPL